MSIIHFVRKKLKIFVMKVESKFFLQELYRTQLCDSIEKFEVYKLNPKLEIIYLVSFKMLI